MRGATAPHACEGAAGPVRSPARGQPPCIPQALFARHGKFFSQPVEKDAIPISPHGTRIFRNEREIAQRKYNFLTYAFVYIAVFRCSHWQNTVRRAT